MNRTIVAFALVPALLLAACEDEAADSADTSATGGEAAGDVLGGTISDDMLPLDALTSTSPPAARNPVTGSGDGESGDGPETSADGEAAAEGPPADDDAAALPVAPPAEE